MTITPFVIGAQGIHAYSAVKQTPNTGHIPSLDLLRGIASLSVCLFHFTNGNPNFLPAGTLKHFGAGGWVGVEAFFVISGFVIPFALHRAHYTLSNFGTFLLKRMLRLDPPYLVSITIILGLGYLSGLVPGFRGPPFHVSFPQLALHLGYANAFVGYPWLNPVFWTLALEAQFYLLIGLVFPLLISARTGVQFGTMGALVVAALVFAKQEFVFHWLLLFLLGISTFQYRRRAVSLHAYVTVVAVLTCFCVVTYGMFVAAVGLLTAFAIAFLTGSMPPVAVFFGRISYSLYLLHAPIGGRVVNLGERFATTLPTQLIVICAAFAASVSAAWLLHQAVERPAQCWSSSIGYRKRVVAPSGFGPREA